MFYNLRLLLISSPKTSAPQLSLPLHFCLPFVEQQGNQMSFMPSSLPSVVLLPPSSLPLPFFFYSFLPFSWSQFFFVHLCTSVPFVMSFVHSPKRFILSGLILGSSFPPGTQRGSEQRHSGASLSPELQTQNTPCLSLGDSRSWTYQERERKKTASRTKGSLISDHLSCNNDVLKRPR